MAPALERRSRLGLELVLTSRRLALRRLGRAEQRGASRRARSTSCSDFFPSPRLILRLVCPDAYPPPGQLRPRGDRRRPRLQQLRRPDRRGRRSSGDRRGARRRRHLLRHGRRLRQPRRQRGDHRPRARRPPRPGRARDEVRPRPRRRRDRRAAPARTSARRSRRRSAACRRTGSTSTSTTGPTASRRSRRRSRRCTSSSRKDGARDRLLQLHAGHGRGGRRVAAERGLTPFVSEQSEYSWLRRDAEDGLLPTCERLGVASSPTSRSRAGCSRASIARRAGARGHPPAGARARDERSDAVERLRAFGERHGASLLEVAIGGLAAAAGVASVIAGRDEAEQVRANAAAGAWEPSAARSRSCARSSRARRDRRRRRARLSRPGHGHRAGDRTAGGADRPGSAS